MRQNKQTINNSSNNVSNRYEEFMEILSQVEKKVNNYVLSANGAVEYKSTGSALVDFDSRTTEFRNANVATIMEAAMLAYAENPVNFVKLIFQTGDVRFGKGERHTFNICMDWLVAAHPAVATEVLSLIPEYTRWDYLVRQTISANETVSKYATDIVINQFSKDIAMLNRVQENKEEDKKTDISLLAKWMPSLQTKKEFDKLIVRHLLKSLHMQEREYRKALSSLRAYLNVVEKAMSAKDYDAIDMEKLTSKQQLRYSNFFKRVMAEKRHEYIQAVLRGEKKMNASVLNPIEILHSYYESVCSSCKYSEDYEAIWKCIPDKTSGNGNTMIVRDGSGSMTDRIGQGSSATMLEAATAMSIYCSEHMSGPFKDKFITFSNRPQFVDLSNCKTLAEKIVITDRYAECSNTDIEKTFDLILNTAIEGKLSQEEIPSYLMILSDMEFDEARGVFDYYSFLWDDEEDEEDTEKVSYISRETLFDGIRKKWQAAGYEMPTLVFWQLNGRRTIFPEIDSENGIIFLSGFSVNELELVMAGKFESIVEVSKEVEVTDNETGETKTVVETHTERVVLTPIQQLELKLSDPRYDAIEAAVNKGLMKEAS